MPLGAPWNSEAASEPFWGWFKHHLGACRLRFSKDFMEQCGFAISTPLSNGMATFTSPDTKLEPSGTKSRAAERSGETKRIGKGKSDPQNTFCLALRLSFASCAMRNRKDFEMNVQIKLRFLVFGTRLERNA